MHSQIRQEHGLERAQELEMGGWVVIEPLDFPEHTPSMATERFQASRWTKGNFLFPTIIEVDEKAVVRRKRIGSVSMK